MRCAPSHGLSAPSSAISGRSFWSCWRWSWRRRWPRRIAWSGVALIAFIPFVGLVVVPLQLFALLLRGVLFEYIALTALGAYVSLYRRGGVAVADPAAVERRAGPLSAWG